MNFDVDKSYAQMDEQFEKLYSIIRPFADEGAKLIDIPDDTKIVVNVDCYDNEAQIARHIRHEATFIVGDLKRAYRLMKEIT